MSGHYSIDRLCETLLVSRSGFYDWRRRRHAPGPRQRENLVLRQRIRVAFEQSRRTYGSPRLARALGCAGSRNRIARLMRVERLRARQRSKFRVVTTDSRHDGPIAPHRLRGVTPTALNEVWTTDVTHILTAQGWLYLAAVLDVHSRKVIGWAMSEILDAPLVVSALHMAIARRQPTHSLIVHSDRGAPYASRVYRQTLAAHRLVPSMTCSNRETSSPWPANSPNSAAATTRRSSSASSANIGSPAAAPTLRNPTQSDLIQPNPT
jgi:putative transposase